MVGHSASEDARERAFAPGIHPFRKTLFSKQMDRRVKPGDDGGEASATELMS
jgi:hypothetical protein